MKSDLLQEKARPGSMYYVRFFTLDELGRRLSECHEHRRAFLHREQVKAEPSNCDHRWQGDLAVEA